MNKSPSKSIGTGKGSAKKYPQHKAREIRSMMNGNFCGWSIYPDQLPAMTLQMQRVLTKLRMVTLTGVAGDTRIVQVLLHSIGLSVPNTKTCHGPEAKP